MGGWTQSFTHRLFMSIFCVSVCGSVMGIQEVSTTDKILVSCGRRKKANKQIQSHGIFVVMRAVEQHRRVPAKVVNPHVGWKPRPTSAWRSLNRAVPLKALRGPRVEGAGGLGHACGLCVTY